MAELGGSIGNVGIALGLGLLTGILSGMLGVGGGIVMIPGMVLLLGQSQHTAQGVSLAVMVVTAAAGAITHYHQHNIKFRLALWIVPSAVVFAFVGAWLVDMIDPLWLQRAFSILILSIGLWMVLARRADRQKNEPRP